MKKGICFVLSFLLLLIGSAKSIALLAAEYDDSQVKTYVENSHIEYRYVIKEDGTAMIVGSAIEGVEQVRIPSGIEGYAVSEIQRIDNSSALEMITVPSTVTKIDENAFGDHQGMDIKEMYLEEGVLEIGRNAFGRVREKVTVPASVVSWDLEPSLGKCVICTVRGSYAAQLVQQKEYRYEYTDEVCLEEQGIKVCTDDTALAKEGVSLKVETLTEGQVYDQIRSQLEGDILVLNLSYENAGQILSPQGTYYRISLPAKENFMQEYMKVYQLQEDGSLAPMEIKALHSDLVGGLDREYLFTTDNLGTLVMSAPHRLGDMDGNNEIDMNDALEILRASVGVLELDDAWTCTADVDYDKEVTVLDALMVIRQYLGLFWFGQIE